MDYLFAPSAVMILERSISGSTSLVNLEVQTLRYVPLLEKNFTLNYYGRFPYHSAVELTAQMLKREGKQT
jgi:hypothetical protein